MTESAEVTVAGPLGSSEEEYQSLGDAESEATTRTNFVVFLQSVTYLRGTLGESRRVYRKPKRAGESVRFATPSAKKHDPPYLTTSEIFNIF